MHFGSSLTVIASGSVGSSSGGSISGSYILQAGTTQSGTAGAIQGMRDFVILSDAASGALCTTTLLTSDLSGLTLAAGVHCTRSRSLAHMGRGAAGGSRSASPSPSPSPNDGDSDSLSLGAWSSVTLDGQGVPTSLWVIATSASGSLSTGAHSSMILTNGAESSNVFWSVGSRVMLGASSFFVGEILAGTDIVLGSGSVLKGRGFAMSSVMFDGGCLVSSSASYSSSSVPMGRNVKDFAILAATSVGFGVHGTVISSGSVGVSAGGASGAVTGTYTLRNGTTELHTASSIAAAGEVAIMYNAGSTLSCGHGNYVSGGELGDLSLSPGVYCSSSGGFSIGQMGAVVLDAHNVSGATWVFQMSGNLTTGPDARVILKNGALASNVYWIVGGSASIGYATSMAGTIVAQSSVRFGSYASLEGRGLSMSTIFYADNTVVNPKRSKSVQSAAPTAAPSRRRSILSAAPTHYPIPVPSVAPSMDQPTSTPTNEVDTLPFSGLVPAASPSPVTLSHSPTIHYPTVNSFMPSSSSDDNDSTNSDDKDGEVLPMKSICIISAIPARYNQKLWSGSNAALAMGQAIAVTMGVLLDDVVCGFANQLCLTSPTVSPTSSPDHSEKKSKTSRALTHYVASMGDVHHRREALAESAKPLSFSLYRSIPGELHFSFPSLIFYLPLDFIFSYLFHPLFFFPLIFPVLIPFAFFRYFHYIFTLFLTFTFYVALFHLKAIQLRRRSI